MDCKIVITLLVMILAIASASPFNVLLDIDFEVNLKENLKISENFTIVGTLKVVDRSFSAEFDYYHAQEYIPEPGSTINYAYGDSQLIATSYEHPEESFTRIREYKSFGFNREYLIASIPDRNTGKYFSVCDVKSFVEGMAETWKWFDCASPLTDNSYTLNVFGERIYMEVNDNMPVRIKRTGRGGNTEEIIVSTFTPIYTPKNVTIPSECY